MRKITIRYERKVDERSSYFLKFLCSFRIIYILVLNTEISWNRLKISRHNELDGVLSPAKLVRLGRRKLFEKYNHLFPICFFDIIFTKVRYR